MEELITEVDKDNNKIGLRPRSDFDTNKYIQRSAHLILINSKDEILLQQRTADKKKYPNLFTFSVSGTVGDETYDEAIMREIPEEIGIEVPVKKLFVYYANSTMGNAFRAVYFARSDKKITPDRGEIQKIVWMNVEDLKNDILENPDIYTPSAVEMLKIFFKDHYYTVA